MKTTLDRKLQERLLLGRRVEGDRLVLADAVLQAALDGSRPLTANERTALAASPLTARRLRQLAIERRGAGAANDAGWTGSAGLLRAADSGAAAPALATDDGFFRLHFAQQGSGWRVILQMAAQAPFAASMLCAPPLLRVRDGAGRVVLQGRLDPDGECEDAWPFDDSPAAHFLQAGGAFTVEPAQP